MKKRLSVLILLITLFSNGCAIYTHEYDHIPLQSSWKDDEETILVNFGSDFSEVNGILKKDDKEYAIDVIFGPEKDNYVIYEVGNLVGDEYLMKGRYEYNKKEETLTLSSEDKKLVLHRYEEN